MEERRRAASLTQNRKEISLDGNKVYEAVKSSIASDVRTQATTAAYNSPHLRNLSPGHYLREMARIKYELMQDRLFDEGKAKMINPIFKH